MNYVDTAGESQTIISFCSGLLGLERGIERAIGRPLNVAAYLEIEAFVIENLLAGMEAGVVDAAPIWTDCKTFPAEIFRNRIHGFTGGYPCQPFSHAGKQLGEEDPRHLWPYIKEHIRAIRPLWCFFENVEGHLNLGYRTVRSDLESLGYTVAEGIFSAEEVGAPHRRKRLFILAILADAESSIRRLLLQSGQPRTTSDEFERSGKSLGYSESTNEQRDGQQSGERQIKAGGSGIEAMADTNHTRLGEFGGAFSIQSQLSSLEYGGHGLWPAGQASYQHSWEEPRTVEPGLGCTVNGYSFRVDLLRALGNGVVEQTAARAFSRLIEKIFSQ